MKITEINISDIEIIENVRTVIKGPAMVELISSIKQNGLLQPIGVAETKSKKYVLVYGHRRLEACKKLGWKTIPTIIGTEMELKDHLITNVTENLQRKDNTPLELGRIISRLMNELGMTKAEIAARLSVSKLVIQSALDCFGNVPADLREKIVYMHKGQAKNGNIAASTMSKIIGFSRKHEFSKDTISKLLETTRKRELSNDDIKTVGRLLDDGFTPAEALKASEKLKSLTLAIVVDRDELDSLCKKHKMSQQLLLTAALYGEIPPLVRPQPKK